MACELQLNVSTVYYPMHVYSQVRTVAPLIESESESEMSVLHEIYLCCSMLKL